MKEVIIFMALAFGIGMFAGKTFAEADMMYQCELRSKVRFTGPFWVDGLEYSCNRVASAKGGE